LLFSHKKLIRPLLVSVIAAIALYVVAAVSSDWATVKLAAAQLGVLGWALILLLSLVNYGLRFVRWQSYLRCFKHTIPLHRHLLYYLAGFAFTTTPGKAGEAARSLYLKRHQVAYKQSLAAFFAERVMDVVVMVLLAAAVVLTFEGTLLPVFIMALAALTLLLTVRTPWLDRLLDRLSQNPQGSRVRVAISHLHQLLRASAQLFCRKLLWRGVLIGLVAWGAEGYAFWLILHYLDIELAIWSAIGIYAASILVGAISFMPGGLGSTEVAMVLLLGAAGIDTPTAIAATLICRLATLWFAVIIGIIAVIMLETGATTRATASDRSRDSHAE